MVCPKTRSFIFTFSIWVSLSLPLFGQATGGRLEGTVRDSSGGVLPGASVTAKNTAISVIQSTVTNDEGYYRIAPLPIGVYEVEVELTGFATQRHSGIKVEIGRSVVLDVSLGVAGQEQQVTVVAETPVIETTRSQVSNVVNDLAVANLPVNGRNFIDFVLLTPGVTRDVRGGDISFGGQRGTLNSLQIDGVDNNNTFFGQAFGRTGSGRAPYQFSQDAVQEFQVNSNSYSAEFGRAGGAVVNVVTKSGTNDFHGTVFEFYRDRSLNANSFFNNATRRPKGPYHFNQFGGNVGGPIVKDRAFFFFDYDGQRNNQPNTIIPGGPKPPSDLDTQAAVRALESHVKTYPRTFNQDVYLAKTDLSLNQDHRLSVRYNRQNFTGKNLENSGRTSAEEHSGASLVTTDTLSGSLTSVFTPKLVNTRCQRLEGSPFRSLNPILPEKRDST